MRDKLNELLKDLRQDYNHPWPNEDDYTKKHRLKMLKRIVETHFLKSDIKRFIPFDKSHFIRMSVLDLFYNNSSKCLDFKDKDLSDDLIALKNAVEDWMHDEDEIRVGESGTLFRFFQFLIWKYNLDKGIKCSGTLINRPITRDKKIFKLSQKELLKLDNGTSQWASAKALFGDETRIKNPPFKLDLTYKCIDEWIPDWKPIMDETIYNQALHFYKLMKGEDSNFVPKQSEDFCFGYMFGKITRLEALERWPSLQGHESNRLEEMDLNIDIYNSAEPLPTKDHRVIHAIAMWAKLHNQPIEFEHPEAAFKSWPFFWSFLENF